MALNSFRKQFQQTINQGIFFDNASMGPVIPAVTEAVTQCMELRQSMPMKYYKYADSVFGDCKKRLASLINASPSEIAFTENVAYGINCAAGSLPFAPGDQVILCDREFSSNIYPWLLQEQKKGIQTCIVPNDHGGLTVDLLEKYATSKTRAVSVSSVEFSDGYATDLQSVGQWCRDHNVFFIVDGAQSLGVMPMDVKKYHIDFLAGLSVKWLLGPFATGFLYIRKELIPQLIPPFAGADSVTVDVDSTDYRLDFKQDAGRFETGLPNAPGIAGLNASLKFMESIGFEKIYKEAWDVSEYFIHRLGELNITLAPCATSEHTRSAIVSFSTRNTPAAYKYLRDHKIACSLRNGYIRTGIHGYNTREEAEEVISILKKFLK